MIHLTHTSYLAGQTYCGVGKNLPGTQYHHMNIRALANPEYRQNVCPACLAIYDDIDNESGEA